VKIILIFLFFGYLYYVLESMFNFITEDLFNSKLTWHEKLRFKTTNSPSFWMIPVASICGIILHLLFQIPLDFTKIYFLIPACIIGGAIITAFELASGYLLNIKLKLNLWNYDTKITLFGKEIPLNYLGQIDIIRSIAWIGITFLFWIFNYLFK
jgi:hypothetical protein